MYGAGFAYMWPDRPSQNQAEVENFESTLFHLMSLRALKLKKPKENRSFFDEVTEL